MPLSEIREDLLQEQDIRSLLTQGKLTTKPPTQPQAILPHTRSNPDDWQANIDLFRQEFTVVERALARIEQQLSLTPTLKLPPGVDAVRSGSLIRPDRGEATLPLEDAFGIPCQVEFANPGDATALGELAEITTPYGVSFRGRRDPIVLYGKLAAAYPVTTIELEGEGAELVVEGETVEGGPVWHLPGTTIQSFTLILSVPEGEQRTFRNLSVFSEQFASVGTLYSQRFELGAEVSSIKLNLAYSYGPYTSIRAELALPEGKLGAPPGSWVELGTPIRQRVVLTAQQTSERQFAFGQERIHLGTLPSRPAKVWRVRVGVGQVAAVPLQGEDLELAAREFQGEPQLLDASQTQVTVTGPTAFRCEWVPTTGSVSLVLPEKSFLLVDDERVEGLAGFAPDEGPRELTLVYTEAGTYPFPLAVLAKELQVAVFRALPWETGDLWRAVAVADDLSVWLPADRFLPGLEVELEYTPWQPPREVYYVVQLARGRNIYSTPVVTGLSWEVR